VGAFAVARRSIATASARTSTPAAGVSDKEILAAAPPWAMSATRISTCAFSVDWIDDQSGVRGAQMLAPNTNRS
jgi:hypothetical protein